MKLKLFFLGMFAAAFFMSCNNEIDGGGGVVPDEQGIVLSTGTPTYVSFNFSPAKANTYAGTGTNSGEPYEIRLYGDAAVFVYQYTGGATTPEAFAYLASTMTSTSNVVLKATDGTKKIFTALNIGGPASGSGGTFFDDAIILDETLLDEGDAFGTPFNTLNRQIWTLQATPWWSATAPTAGNEEGSANGLIRAFAGGSFVNANGLLRGNASTTANNAYFLLSNWDNARRDSVYPPGGTGTYPVVPGLHQNNCIITLKPEITKTNALTENNAHLYVQRAVAKVGLDFAANITLPAPDDYMYESVGADTDTSGVKGYFIPWGASSSSGKGLWALGNLNKVSSVFQKFNGTSVSDDNYAHIAPETQFTEFLKNFDNTRVFGTGWQTLTYADFNATPVSAIRDTMALPGNSSILGADYQYATENAQSFSAGIRDNSTYAIVGGEYIPQFWISKITPFISTSNAPMIEYNLGPAGGIPPADSTAGGKYYGDQYEPIPYTNSGSGYDDGDTLYYNSVYQVFFYGKVNVARYYAWVESRGSATANLSATPEFEQSIQDEIDFDIQAKTLVAYFQGNCFYRIFIVDIDAEASNERVLVRRNHIYNIEISSIIGPGIAEPEFIITPDPVLPVETYLAVTIEIQEWHVVDQYVDVSMNN